MNPRHSVGAFVVEGAWALAASTANAAPPCRHALKEAEPSSEHADRWARAARALPAPRFEGPWSRGAERAFAGRYEQWHARRLALVAAASREWLVIAGVADWRPSARCFAELVERGGSFPRSAFYDSNVAVDVLLVVVPLKGPELDITTWARLARAFTDLLVEEERAEASYRALLPRAQENMFLRYVGNLGPYNELEINLARASLVACVEQSTALRKWTTDSEECEQLRARFFASHGPALDELREPPSYVDWRFPGKPVSLRRRALPPAGTAPPR